MVSQKIRFHLTTTAVILAIWSVLAFPKIMFPVVMIAVLYWIIYHEVSGRSR